MQWHWLPPALLFSLSFSFTAGIPCLMSWWVLKMDIKWTCSLPCTGAGIVGVSVWGRCCPAAGAGLQEDIKAGQFFGAVGHVAGDSGQSGAEATWRFTIFSQSCQAVSSQVVLLQVRVYFVPTYLFNSLHIYTPSYLLLFWSPSFAFLRPDFKQVSLLSLVHLPVINCRFIFPTLFFFKMFLKSYFCSCHRVCVCVF